MILSSFISVAACTPAAQEVTQPDVGITATRAFAGATNEARVPMNMGTWWTSLGAATLNDLVTRLETQNPDLAAASLRLLQSEIAFLDANSKRLPTVTAANTISETSATDQQGDRSSTTTFGRTLQASWEVDIVGRIAAEGDAAAADLLSSEFDRQALENALIANLVRSYIDVAFDKRQIAATSQIVQSREATLGITQERFSLGVVAGSAGNLLSAQESLAAARADLPEQRLSLARNINALDVTVGRLPASQDRYGITLPEAPPARAGAVGLPVDLLRRRPDIRAAEANLVSANTNIRVSIADRFPSLTLSGSLQSNGSEIEDLLDVDNIIASLVADLALTVFDGGRGTRLIALRQTQAEELAQSYVSTVLTAVAEVENALAGERLLAEQARQLRVRRDAARQATNNARERYQQGAGSYLTLLDASRSQVNAENAYLNVQRSRWTNRVDLMLALGGDWTPAPQQAATPQLEDEA